MNEIQVKVPRKIIERAAHNVSNFNCEHRTATFIKMEDGKWTHNLCCEAGHRCCDCSDECGERIKAEKGKYMPFGSAKDVVYGFLNLPIVKQDRILKDIGVCKFPCKDSRAAEIGYVMDSIESSCKVSEFCEKVYREVNKI